MLNGKQMKLESPLGSDSGTVRIWRALIDHRLKPSWNLMQTHWVTLQ